MFLYGTFIAGIDILGACTNHVDKRRGEGVAEMSKLLKRDVFYNSHPMAALKYTWEYPPEAINQ